MTKVGKYYIPEKIALELILRNDSVKAVQRPSS